CFRDEDLRADRVQEITQLDVEMAFPDQEFLFALMERMIRAAWRDCLDVELEAAFPRLTWAEADARFGSDKPDLRFGLELEDATEITRDSQFGVFGGAPCVRFIRVPQAFSRAELDRLQEVAKEWGAKGLAYIVYGADGEARSPIAKFLSADELAAFAAPPASTVLFGAGDPAMVARVLGGMRLHIARELELTGDGDVFHWVIDFPLFERDEDSGNWTFLHHPFTAPIAGDEDFEGDPGAAKSQHYDLIWNGWELGSGSIRIHRSDVQAAVFRVMGIADDEVQSKYG